MFPHVCETVCTNSSCTCSQALWRFATTWINIRSPCKASTSGILSTPATKELNCINDMLVNKYLGYQNQWLSSLGRMLDAFSSFSVSRRDCVFLGMDSNDNFGQSMLEIVMFL